MKEEKKLSEQELEEVVGGIKVRNFKSCSVLNEDTVFDVETEAELVQSVNAEHTKAQREI